MLFTSLLGRRRRGARRTQTNGLRRPQFRPLLEILEDRLAPGDVVLGSLLASGFAGPSLDDWGSLPSLLEHSLSTDLPAKHRPLHADVWSILEDDRIALSPTFAPSDQPSRQDSTPGGNFSPRGAEPGWEGLSPVFAAEEAPRLSALAGSLGFDTTPTAANNSFSGGVEHPAPAGAAGPTGAAPAAAGASFSPSTALPSQRLGDGNEPASEPAAAPAIRAAVGHAAHPSGDAEAAVQAGFDLTSLRGGPSPSNYFTVADPSQLTGRRINLPLPDPTTHPSDYADVQLLNTLDGFNLQPRLSVPFDGPIDVNSVSSDTVFLIRLGDVVDHQDHGGQVVGINQVVWDPDSNTLHVESDELLDQHTRYALIVTCGVRDTAGNPVGASEAFRRFRDEVRGEYKHDLLDAVQAAHQLGIREQDVVTASVFTTQSATAVLEKIRDQIHAATPAPADFLLGPGGTRTLFSLDDVTGITWSQQTRVDAPLSPVSLATELTALRDLIPGAVSGIAYGKYTSPEYLVHPGEFIPPVATRTGTPQVQSTVDVYFNVVLPSGPMPEGGWPVAIYGTGQEGAKDTWLLRVAASNASHGIATVSINYYGRGFGPSSTITVESSVGGPVTFLAGGRSVDQLGNGDFGGGFGGRIALNPMISIRDSHRQTAADWMQLVRVIQAGVDVEEDGIPDLDPSRIYYFGNSVGGLMGPLFMAVEPDVHAGVLNAFGGEQSMNTRLSSARAPNWSAFLAQRQPSLINGPGVTSIDGMPTPGPAFNENLPLRDGVPLEVRLSDGTTAIIQSPVINTVQGAMDIQEVMERREWIMMAGEAVAYAPHLRKSPLAGVPAKSMIIQFALGDTNQLNPTTTALLRAGDLADRATFYRHDLAFAEDPTLDRNPHQFLIRVVAHPGERRIALGYQSQIAAFFASDGTEIIHPEPARFFEVPIVGPLPEGLNFIL